MNLEHLCKLVILNYHTIKNKKWTFLFLKYQIKVLEIKKNKLKLGSIVFEIKEFMIEGIILWEEVDIRFIRQDNTVTDELKLENRLKAIAWKWDFRNMFSLALVSFIFFIFLYSNLYVWYCNNLPSLAFRDDKYNQLIYFSIESTFSYQFLDFFNKWLYINLWLINILVDFCLTFNILF